MPRFAAEKVLNDPNASLSDIHKCIGRLSEEIGNLNCRSGADPQLTGDLRELVELKEKLEEKYDAKSTSESKNS